MNTKATHMPPRPWCILGPNGEVIKRYETQDEAVDDIIDRHLRSVELGVKPDYLYKEDK